ncbi:protein prune [Salix suchowensis]|nr:protein prune [Salix suchowensis]
MFLRRIDLKTTTCKTLELAALSGTRNDSTTSLHCVSSVSIAIITNMRPPPKAKPQDSYIRGQSISPSTSDNGDLRGISFSDIPGKFKDLPVKDSVSNILEPFAQTTLGTSSKIPRSTSFEFQSSQSDISFDLGGSNHSVKRIQS